MHLRCRHQTLVLGVCHRAALLVFMLLVFAASVSAQTQTVQYTYDSLDRLTAVRYADRLVQYNYDAAANRILMTVVAINPIPAVTAVSSVVVAPANETVSILVTGTGFVDGSVVQWNGQARVTTFVSATELLATLLPADIATAGSAALTVVNPQPGGGESTTFSLTVSNPAPVVTQATPASVVVGSAGFTLVVTGSGFVNGTTVRWNGEARPTTFISWTRIEAAIPASDLAATGSVVVTTVNSAPGGGVSPSGATVVIRHPAPTVSSIAPASGPAAGGTLLTLTGTGFQTGAVLSLGGVTVRSVSVVSSTSMTATTDAHVAALVDVVITNPDTQTATLPDGFRYVAELATPVITWANPAGILYGTALGDTQLNATANVAGTFAYTPEAGTVLHAGAGQTLSVTFTPTDAANYTSTTKTVLIDVVAPVPTLTQVTPASGAIGTAVTLTGTGFTETTAITFNGVAASFTVVSDTEITTTVPAGTTTGPVRVTTPGGTAVSAADFDVTNQRANRTLPVCYAPGYASTVTVELGPAPEVRAHALDEQPPAGWARGAVSHGGVWDAATSMLKWGPFEDAAARTVTYELTPPAESTGAVTFAGVVRFDGVDVPVGGAKTLARCEQHPADANGDGRLTISEVTGYGAAWKKGNTWSTPPVPIPISYVTRAGYLWRMGETYRRDEGACPVCWTPLEGVPLAR